MASRLGSWADARPERLASLPSGILSDWQEAQLRVKGTRTELLGRPAPRPEVWTKVFEDCSLCSALQSRSCLPKSRVVGLLLPGGPV